MEKVPATRVSFAYTILVFAAVFMLPALFGQTWGIVAFGICIVAVFGLLDLHKTFWRFFFTK